MPVSMHQISLPVMQRLMRNLVAVLAKAEALATAKKLDPEVLPNARLAPDMFPLKRQIQIVSDMARGAACRLSGNDLVKWTDEEKTLAELKTRLERTIDFVAGFKPADIDASAGRDITLTIAGQQKTLPAADYLMTYAYPHFYFHVVTAYDILRHNGVEIGKRDYLGTF